MLHTDVGCPLCGDTGIHACIGRRLPPPSPEVEARLTTSLERIFGPLDKEKRKEQTDALFPRTFCTTPQGKEQAASEGLVETVEPSESLT